MNYWNLTFEFHPKLWTLNKKRLKRYFYFNCIFSSTYSSNLLETDVSPHVVLYISCVLAYSLHNKIEYTFLNINIVYHDMILKKTLTLIMIITLTKVFKFWPAQYLELLSSESLIASGSSSSSDLAEIEVVTFMNLK